MISYRLSKRIFLIAIIAAFFATSLPLQAKERKGKTIVGGTVEGAMLGGILGNIFGDKEDGKKAAKIGAVLGALGAADKQRKEREQAYREQLMRIEKERIELERQMQVQQAQKLALQQQTAQRSAPVQPLAQSISSSDTVKQIERSLIVLGFLEPPITGTYGPILQQAIKTYQRVSRIPVDGQASQALLEYMLANGG